MINICSSYHHLGISMHKGYAFVQFTGPFDARSACLGEDGRTICGQVIDVNMVSEPKPHQQGKGSGKAQKRPREDSPAEEYVFLTPLTPFDPFRPLLTHVDSFGPL